MISQEFKQINQNEKSFKVNGEKQINQCEISFKSKSDIRSYGKMGLKSCQMSDSKRIEKVNCKIDALRYTRSENLVPCLNDRITAGYLIDELENGVPIDLKKSNHVKVCDKPLQKSGKENMCFAGADVVSLFPSLLGVETARLARHAVLQTDVEFENIDYLMALRYLRILGGVSLLEKAGIGRLAPTWKGKRDDLITIGGKKSRDESNWRDTKRTLWASDKKKIVALLVETLTNLVMSTHVYTFGGNFYL